MKKINDLVYSAHNNAKDKGFYDLPNGILEKMISASQVAGKLLFSDEEIKAVKDAFITQRLMLIVSELGEALEANRKNRYANVDHFHASHDFGAIPFKQNFQQNIKDSFEDELADSTIRIADLAGWLGIDLQWHVRMKHKYNSDREKMHGGKAY